MIGRRFFLWLFGAAAVAPVLPRARAATPPFPYVMMHADVHGPTCMGPAFYLRREIKPGDLLLSADAALLDGSPMPYGSLPMCGTCGKRVTPRTAFIHPVMQ